MGIVKNIEIKVISARVANNFVKEHHYSGKVVPNSSLHLGAFYNGRLHGVMQYGSPMVKRNVLSLVEGTLWNEMLELNRMAFDDFLPKNSESRALSISFKLIKKNAPHIKWVLSFSDGCQSGDGTIYRATGFYLTQIKKNKSLLQMPNGEILANMTISAHRPGMSYSRALKSGAKPLIGYQLRYIKLLHEGLKLNCAVLPYSAIREAGAGMYKGQKRVVSIDSDASGVQPEEGGANPTTTLQKYNEVTHG